MKARTNAPVTAKNKGSVARNYTPLIARILIAGIFLWSGADKVLLSSQQLSFNEKLPYATN